MLHRCGMWGVLHLKGEWLWPPCPAVTIKLWPLRERWPKSLVQSHLLSELFAKSSNLVYVDV